MMKKIAYGTFLCSLLAFGSATALARDGRSDESGTLRVEAGADVKMHTQNSNRPTPEDSGEKGKDGRFLERAREKAAEEIERRIKLLGKLENRADELRRVSEPTKAKLSAAIDAQIKALTDLKIKINSAPDAAAIRDDIASVATSHKIFALVIPKGTIIATADRIVTTADLMAKFGEKLQARITAVHSAGGSVGALETAYADFTAKIADARVQAKAAVDLVSNLTAGDGDKALLEANRSALAQARAKIKAGQADLRLARKSAEKIVNGVKGKHRGDDRRTDASVSANAQAEITVEQ